MTLFLFTVFSGACGASQSIIQLIMFRWLQGIGGCGILALSQLVFVELVPSEKYPKYIGIVSIAMTAPLVLGPLVGGGISLSGDWRWIFLLNVPLGVVIMLFLFIVFPQRLNREPRNQHGPFSISFLRRIDFLGCMLLLGTCLLLTTGLQQAARGYNFESPFVLPLLICSAPFFVAFLMSQWFTTTRRSNPEPVFPWRFFQSRVRAAVILITLLNGGVLSICVVQIPQRFMTVNGSSPFAAAAKLLAFGAFVIFGTITAVPAMDRLHVRPSLIMAAGSCLEIIGTAILSQASSEWRIRRVQYGCQILIGTGVGFIVSAVMMLIKSSFEERDFAVATAAQSQFRTLGGLIGVSIGTTITNRSLEPKIRSILPAPIATLLLERTEALSLLSGDALARVRVAFGTSYNRQMYLAIGLAAACLPVAAMAWTTVPAAVTPGISDEAEKPSIIVSTVPRQSPVAETV